MALLPPVTGFVQSYKMIETLHFTDVNSAAIKLLVRIMFLDQVNVHCIADDYVAFFEHLMCPHGHVLEISGSDPDDIELIQSKYPPHIPQERMSSHSLLSFLLSKVPEKQGQLHVRTQNQHQCVL